VTAAAGSPYPSILAGVVVGALTRAYLLRADFRIYPTYPHGWVTHLSLGVVAALLGAVIVPAIAAREFTAAAFVALAAQQFREVRAAERDSLAALEQMERVARGADYVEGIARVFEARNYLSMLTAAVASGMAHLLGWQLGLAAGILSLLVAAGFRQGKQVGGIAEVRPGRLHFEGSMLYVDDVQLMAVGLRDSRQYLLRHGRGVILEPRDLDARATLATSGQRQAIAHDAAAAVGLRKDYGTPEFTPLVRVDLDTGRVGLVIVPIHDSLPALIEGVRRVPLLESARRRPLSSAVRS
jgi:hypothetical protein